MRRRGRSVVGLLHQSTQIGERTHATTSNWQPNVIFEALGANHNEFNEHAGTRDRLNRIFDGLDNTPAFFRTNRR
ncbi:MAG: hypothetical protein ACFCUU_11005 [Cyclobacteriaceae bacterium]